MSMFIFGASLVVSTGIVLTSIAGGSPRASGEEIPDGLTSRSVLEIANECMIEKGTIPEGSQASDFLGGVSPDGEITPPEERAIAGDAACLQRALEATMAAIVSDEPASELTGLVETAEAGELPASASEAAPTTVSSAAYKSKTVAAIPAGFTWSGDSSPLDE